jgi:hypothetical protein
MKKCRGRSRIPTQENVIWGNGWYGGHNRKNNRKKCLKLGLSRGQVSCPRVWGRSRYLPPSLKSPQQKCYHVGSHASFHSCSKFSTGASSPPRKPGLWRTHFTTQPYYSIPPKILDRCTSSPQSRPTFIPSPHLLVLATSERFLLARGTFRAILASESHWLQPVLVRSVRWWPAPTCVGRVLVTRVKMALR